MPSLSFYERQHVQRLLKQQNDIAKIFNQFCVSISPELRKWTDTGKSSVWVRNSAVENAIESQLIALQSLLMANIHTNQEESFSASNLKNDELISAFIQGMAVSETLRKGMFARNVEALASLQQRTTNGMDLSERIWRITDQTKTQLEFYLKSGLSSGRPATQISQDVRQLLENPNKRFHRIRNEKGELVPSQPMKDYHPGPGQYRSSKMNALRLAATETNIAYRKSDSDRWQGLDFILGIDIRRSPSAKEPCKICDPLEGEYPKGFVFTGWHPFCICVATPKMMSPEEFANYLLTGKLPENKIIRNIPSGAIELMENNEYMRQSYAYRDNKEWFEGKVTSSYSLNEQSIKPSKPKRVKADLEKNDIQKRWNDRIVRNFNQKKIEEKLYIQRGSIMSFEEADELRGNINYGTAKEYGVNCQSCVVANELRRRGYDVTAMPNIAMVGNIPHELSKRTNWAWIDPETMTIPAKKTAGGAYDVTKNGAIKSKNLTELNKELSELVREPGRYHIDFAWKGENMGHIVTLERLGNGKIIIYDPQSGKIINWAELSKRIKLLHGVKVLRVDNLLVNTDIIDGIVKKLR